MARSKQVVQNSLTPAQWYALHHAAGLPSPLGIRKLCGATYGVLTRLQLVEIKFGMTDWAPTKAGLSLIERLKLERQRTLTSHSPAGSVPSMAKDIKPGRVSSQMPVTMTGAMHDAIDKISKEFGVSRSKVVVDCVDDALVRVRRRYADSLLTRAAG